jgi:hypothetical protein
MNPPDEIQQALVRQWVASARDDLAWAEMGAADPSLPGPAQMGFHAQQAIETLLKGLLTAYGVEPEEQHNLARLVEQVRRLETVSRAASKPPGVLKNRPRPSSVGPCSPQPGD